MSEWIHEIYIKKGMVKRGNLTNASHNNDYNKISTIKNYIVPFCSIEDASRKINEINQAQQQWINSCK